MRAITILKNKQTGEFTSINEIVKYFNRKDVVGLKIGNIYIEKYLEDKFKIDAPGFLNPSVNKDELKMTLEILI